MAHTFKKVVIAIDGTPLSKHAWEVAQTQILNKGDAIEFLVVHEPVIHSIPFDGYYEMIYDADQAVRSHLHKVVKPYVKEAESAGFAASLTLLEGSPKLQMAEYMSKHKDADLLVLGTHGRSGFSRFTMGSVAEHMLRHSTIPVYIVPGKENPKKEGETEKTK